MSTRAVHEACAVCEKVRPCEKHHMIPQRAAGPDTPTLPLRRSCHDAVDRTPLRDWDMVEAMTGITAAWQGLEADGRLLLLKMFAIACDASTRPPRDASS